jgi:hypothetical protein
VATLWVPLDGAHAKAQRQTIRDAGRRFPVAATCRRAHGAMGTSHRRGSRR